MAAIGGDTISAEVLVLTYGSLVRQLVADLDDVAAVNKQLDTMGFNIGTRLVDEYLAKTRTTKCGGFPDAMTAAARGACRAFLGVPGVLSDWSADRTAVTLSLPDNPLADGVELPASLAAGGLWYSNILAGALRGALAQVNLGVETAFIADPLLQGVPTPLSGAPGGGEGGPGGAAPTTPPAAAIRVRLVVAAPEAYPFKDED